MNMERDDTTRHTGMTRDEARDLAQKQARERVATMTPARRRAYRAQFQRAEDLAHQIMTAGEAARQ